MRHCRTETIRAPSYEPMIMAHSAATESYADAIQVITTVRPLEVSPISDGALPGTSRILWTVLVTRWPARGPRALMGRQVR